LLQVLAGLDRVIRLGGVFIAGGQQAEQRQRAGASDGHDRFFLSGLL
jgi:hypothetical protein